MFDISGTAGSWLYRPLWVPVVVDPAMAHHKPSVLARCVTVTPAGSFFHFREVVIMHIQGAMSTQPPPDDAGSSRPTTPEPDSADDD